MMRGSGSIQCPEIGLNIRLPLYTAGVSAGFPSPAEDYIDRHLDLNEYLIKHPAATFFVRVDGDSMVDAGIYHGDILIVDRSIEPEDGRVVIAVVNGEMTVKRLCRRGGALYLIPESAQYSPLEIAEGMDFQVWGVVSHVIHKV